MTYLLMMLLVFSIYEIRTGNFFRKPESMPQASAQATITEGSIASEGINTSANDSIDSAKASTSFEKKEYKIDKHCYLNNFSEQNFPWQQADCLNFEEVFKNYQYYETIYQEKDMILTVKKYITGKLVSTIQYLITPVGHLKLQK